VRPGSSVQPAEQLPLSYLPRLARMKEGEIAVFDAPAGALVVQLMQAQEAPLSEPRGGAHDRDVPLRAQAPGAGGG